MVVVWTRSSLEPVARACAAGVCGELSVALEEQGTLTWRSVVKKNMAFKHKGILDFLQRSLTPSTIEVNGITWKTEKFQLIDGTYDHLNFLMTYKYSLRSLISFV
jgi:hypothetical protein